MKLPSYINCRTNTKHCDYVVHRLCKNTCPYVRELGLGIGAADPETVKRLEGKFNSGKE